MESHSVNLACSAEVQYQLIAASASWVQTILPFSASWVTGITGARYHAQLIFVFLVEMGFCHDGQASLQLLTSSDPPTSGSQSARITALSLFYSIIAGIIFPDYFIEF